MVYMNPRTCFDILKVSRNASLDEAKESYKRLVRLWHPDQYGNFPEKQMIAQEKLKEVNVAYRDIVAILKGNPTESRNSLDVKDAQRQPEKKAPHSAGEKSTFRNPMAVLFHATVIRLQRFFTWKTDVSYSAGAARPTGAGFAERGGGIEPDFSQILKRAVHERRLNGAGRQRRGSRKRGGRHFRNISSYRAYASRKRSPFDRVEKIAPVGRVKRIGGENM